MVVCHRHVVKRVYLLLRETADGPVAETDAQVLPGAVGGEAHYRIPVGGAACREYLNAQALQLRLHSGKVCAVGDGEFVGYVDPDQREDDHCKNEYYYGEYYVERPELRLHSTTIASTVYRINESLFRFIPGMALRNLPCSHPCYHPARRYYPDSGKYGQDAYYQQPH